MQKKELLKRLKEAFVKHINADGEIIQKYSKNAQNLNRILLYFNSILDDVQTKFQKDVSEKRRAAIARGTKVSREESLEFESAEIIQKELSTFKSEAENKVNEYTQNKSRITDLASRMENTVLLIFKGIGDGEDESFVSLNAGAFMMGEEQGSRDAMPAHSVTLNPFAIKTTLVTQKDWVNVMGDKNPSFFKGDNLPVENVSYIDCALFCNKLSEKQKLTPCYQIKGDVVKCDFSANGYRLPTEAEWEFAARAGENNDSDFSLEDVAWYKENSSNSTQPVSMKKANSFGLYDMLGNVAEWCNDFYEPKYYSKDDDWDNPIGPISGEERVIRGGSYNSSERMCSITYRNCLDLLEHNKYTGFRIVTKGK